MGFIYKIISNNFDKYYIGSTRCDLKQRLSIHKHDLKRYKAGNFHYLSSFDVLEKGDYRIELLEETDNLIARESYYQQLYRDEIVNKVIHL